MAHTCTVGDVAKKLGSLALEALMAIENRDSAALQQIMLKREPLFRDLATMLKEAPQLVEQYPDIMIAARLEDAVLKAAEAHRDELRNKISTHRMQAELRELYAG